MVGGVPLVYRGGGENIISSYDFKDIASGIGYEVFYLMVANHGTDGVKYILTPNSAFYSYTPETVTTSGTAYTFDSSTFNLPRVVKGTAVVNIGLDVTASGGDDTVAAQLWKWDGTTATAITAQVTAPVINTSIMISFAIPCTETMIKQGEALRLIITMAVNDGDITWGHDPAGRTSDTAFSSSRINVPFKVDA